LRPLEVSTHRFLKLILRFFWMIDLIYLTWDIRSQSSHGL